MFTDVVGWPWFCIQWGDRGGGRDDNCPTIDFVEQCQVMHPVARLQR